jgi:hypothetical protein
MRHLAFLGIYDPPLSEQMPEGWRSEGSVIGDYAGRTQ